MNVLKFEIPIPSAESARELVLREVRVLIEQLSRIEEQLQQQFKVGSEQPNQLDTCGYSLEFLLCIRGQLAHLTIESESIGRMGRVTRAILRHGIERLLKKIFNRQA